MTNKALKVAGILVLVTILAGCMGPAKIKPASNPKASAAYGNITIPDKYITNVMLYKVGEIYAPPFKSPPRSHTYMNGNFFFEASKPSCHPIRYHPGQLLFHPVDQRDITLAAVAARLPGVSSFSVDHHTAFHSAEVFPESAFHQGV